MRGSAGLLAVSLFVTPVAHADQAEIALPTALAARVVAGTHSGLSVSLEAAPGGALATVSQSVRALALDPVYPVTGRLGCGDVEALTVPTGFALPVDLAGLSGRPGSALAVLAAVVEFVTQRVALDEADPAPQDAVAVLARGRARCSGRANLAVGLLRRLGIPARVAHGIVLENIGARWHRWGEAWLGTLGWVPFDPGASVGLVSVRYLPLSGADPDVSLAGVRLEHLEERGYLGVAAQNGVRVLPAVGVTLRCVTPASASPSTALLIAPDGSRWARRGRGELVFERMLPGRYRILWRGSGRPGALDVSLGAVSEVLVELGAGGRAGT